VKLVVGLGNPGDRYEETRHNIGRRLVSRFAGGFSLRFQERFSSRFAPGEFKGEKLLFLLPETYMNRSGEAVSEAVRFYKIRLEELLVVHDDLDLMLGRVKLDFNAGSAGHNGVASVIEKLGDKRFSRIRLGIGRPERKEETEAFVLSPFFPEEWDQVAEMEKEALDILGQWILKEGEKDERTSV